MALRWKAGDNDFRRSSRFQIAGFIRKSDDALRLTDVDVLRIGALRVERNAEWPLQLAGKNRRRRRSLAKRKYAPTPALGNEYVTVWGHSDDTRLPQTARKDVDGK